MLLSFYYFFINISLLCKKIYLKIIHITKFNMININLIIFQKFITNNFILVMRRIIKKNNFRINQDDI